jgi:hypothetical protein
VKNPLFIIFGACLGGIYILLSILMDSGNAIGNICRFLTIGSCTFAFIQPKRAIYWIIFLAAYSDLIKRMMVLDWRFDKMDILWSRALTPMTLACILLSLMLRGLRDNSIFQKRHFKSLLLCTGGFLFAAVSAMRSDGVTEGLMSLADGYSYMFLIFVIPCLFQTTEEMMSYVKFFLIVFVPVALYGIKQQFFGLSEFEIDYLKSGKTILIKHLEDVRPRPFSTLCDNSPYATTCAIMACLSMMLRGYYRSIGKHIWQFTGVLTWGVYVIGCITSLSRLPNLNWALPFLLLIPLRNARSTIGLYGAMAILFILACVFAAELKSIVEQVTLWAMGSPLANNTFGEQLSRFWTLGARLDGMHDLAYNPRMWTVFGYGTSVTQALLSSEEVHSHDPVSKSILTIGWLPSGILLIIIIFCIVALHRSVFSLRTVKADFYAGIWMLATIFGLVFHNLFGGSVTTTTPVNFFFWFMAGAINTMLGHQQRLTAKTEAHIPKEQTQTRQAVIRPIKTFRPSFKKPNRIQTL